MTTAEHDRETLRDTIRRTRSAQKGVAAGAPAYSVYVNRRMGRLLAAAAFQLRLTPNAVTAVSALFTFASIAVIALVPTMWWTGIVAGIGLIIGYAFDSADGQLARLRGGGSISGEWLDHVIDCVKTSTLHLAVAIALFRFAEPPAPWLLLPLTFSAVATTAFFSQILNDQLKAVHRLRTGVTPARREGSPLRSILLLPTDYGITCLVMLLLGFTPAFLLIYAALLAAQGTHLALTLVKWFGDMRALDRDPAS